MSRSSLSLPLPRSNIPHSVTFTFDKTVLKHHDASAFSLVELVREVTSVFFSENSLSVYKRWQRLSARDLPSSVRHDAGCFLAFQIVLVVTEYRLIPECATAGKSPSWYGTSVPPDSLGPIVLVILASVSAGNVSSGQESRSEEPGNDYVPYSAFQSAQWSWEWLPKTLVCECRTRCVLHMTLDRHNTASI